MIGEALRKFDKKALSIFEAFLSGDHENPHRPLYALFRAAVIACLLVFIINALSIGESTFGEWGDFFGGVLNPILTFLTFMGLLFTIVLQQTELRESRKEFQRSANALELQNQAIEKQNFESTFFQMLLLHNQIVNSIDLVKSETGQTTRGRDCFSVFYTRLAKHFRATEEAHPEMTQQELIDLAYKRFWNDTQSELGHYFRYLYNIIRFVKDSDVETTTYIRLLRAQISDQEMLLLFYNCLMPQGAAFKKLVEEFALLDNMPRIKLLEKSHEELLEQSAYRSAD